MNKETSTNDKETPARVGSATGSASQIDRRSYQVAMAYEMMSRTNELQQADRIARHYLMHAATAQHLLKLIELTRYGDGLTDDAKAAIKYLADQIRDNHAHDLGIELSWPNVKAQTRAEDGS